MAHPTHNPAGNNCIVTGERGRFKNSSPLDKMTAISADDIFKCIFMNEKVCISSRISIKFVPEGPINYKPASVQVMAWRQTGVKPLPEPMLTLFIDAYMRH